MRKKIALILALAMLFSMIVPMSATAASDNEINRVPTVAEETKFEDPVTAPWLIMEESRAGDFESGQRFRLSLTNAEFLDAIEDWDGTTNGTVVSDVYMDITKRTDTSVTVEILGDTPNANEKREIIIPMLTEVDEEGEARVTIDPLGSTLSGQTLTFAIVSDGDTIATVVDDEEIGRGTSQTGTILIDEATISALAEERQQFRLRMPRNMEWGAGTAIRQEGLNWANLQWLDNEGNWAAVPTENGVPTLPEGIGSLLPNSGRDLTLRFDITQVSGTRGTVIIDTFTRVTRDARFGDINVSLTGQEGQISDASNLKIGEYVDFVADVSVDEIIEMYAGRVDDDYEVTIEIDQSLDFTLAEGRFIEFTVPSWAAIVDASHDGDGQFDEVNDQTWEYEVAGTDGDIEFDFELVVEANAVPLGTTSVDLEMNIVGAGVPDTDVVVADVLAPITIEVAEQEMPFEIGTQRQSAPDITIIENYAGAIMDGANENEIAIFVRDAFANSLRFDDADYEVLAGDLEVDDFDVFDEALVITVDVSSDEEPAEIRIYNIEMTLDRTVPMGVFRMDVGGSALINEDYRTLNASDERDWGFVERVGRFDYFTVGTPVADVDPAKATVAFTIGQNSYMVDGEMMVMDVAPFIADDRIMVPVRYLEELFGMQPIWNENARTVTVMYEGKVFEMTIGSRMLNVNGAPYLEMDAEAQIVGSRTFVPASRFARAMNIPYTWDAATQTATFN